MSTPAHPYEHDVFISYSHANQDWVRDWLVPTLRKAGIRVCVDYDGFRVGEPIVTAIERAITTSRKTLVVLTPSYLGSSWGEFENILVQTMDPNAQQRRLLPIMHIACEPPLRIRALKWVDLQQPDAMAVTQLLAAIKEETLPVAPTKSPVWPEPAAPAKAPAAELCIEFGRPPAKGAAFPMTVRFPQQGTSAGPYKFKPPLDEQVLRDLYWYLEVYPSWPTEIDDLRARQVEANLRNWGRKLFRKVFGDGEARALFDVFKRTPADARLLTVDIAFKADGDDEDEQTRLKQAIHDLAGLPWELLADEGGHLFNLKPPISIRRRLQKINAPVERPRQLPVRVLMAVSRPNDATFIDPRTIAVPLLDALETLGDSVEVEFLRPPTLAALQSRLDDDNLPPVDILHFDGHGVYRHDTGLGYLLFEDDNHGSDQVNADQLSTLLNQRGVAVVILNACQSAKAEEANPFGSVASRLVEAGIGSVVAMNYSLLVSTAERLATALYGNLAAGWTVGQALDGARRKLLSDTVRGKMFRGGQEVAFHLTDWFLPALYQQTRDPAPFRGASPHTLLPPARGREGVGVAPAGRGVRAGFPPEPVHGFHGRARELLALERLFADKAAVVLHGFGGQGKTSLATHAAWWLTRTGLFERAAFLSFEDGKGLDVVLAELGAALVGDDFAIHAGDKIQAIADALAATPTLVVFDNFESVLPAGDVPLPPDALKALLDAAERWFGPNDRPRNTQYAPRNTQYASRLLLTTRDPALPHAFLTPGRACARYELPGLAGSDALEFAGTVLADGGLPRPPRDALARLLEFLGGHPLSIQLVLPHLGEAEAKVKAEGKDAVAAVIEEFDALLPGFTQGAGAARNQSLEVSLRFSLRRLGPAAAALLPRLAVFRGGAIETVLLAVTEIDAATWAALKPALANAALIRIEALPGVSVPYIHFHPTLAPFLARELTAEQTAALEERYWREYYRFANFLYRTDTQNPIQARAVAARELPNLRRGLRLALAAAALDEAVAFADSINRFLNYFGRWRERDEVAAEVERAVANQQISKSANRQISKSANRRMAKTECPERRGTLYAIRNTE